MDEFVLSYTFIRNCFVEVDEMAVMELGVAFVARGLERKHRFLGTVALCDFAVRSSYFACLFSYMRICVFVYNWFCRCCSLLLAYCPACVVAVMNATNSCLASHRPFVVVLRYRCGSRSISAFRGGRRSSPNRWAGIKTDL